MSIAATDGVRLQKVLARIGFGSRRSVEVLIEQRRVTVNGEVAVLGRRVDPESDRVEVDGVPVGILPGLVYRLVNKPAGVISTARDPEGRPTILELVPASPRVFAVGRLDFATEGLIILTNDGELAQLLAHPSHGVEKEYLAEIEGDPGPAALRRLREGVEIEPGVVTAAAKVSRRGPGLLRIVVHEGRYHEVRRMCEQVGHPVVRLVRTRIGPVRDPRLSPGSWRELRPAEVRALREAAVEQKDPLGASR
ncbi:MAG TPA: pseudouridine synthase [Acidimicrobiales bacterium]|nr:pseudouridine synthase [Acidimicrobiales bacterium]